ncbi:MAG: thioesterase [Crocinitomicaceae bacterium]|nr:thioesterase [Crocinitomicaceae bacterium]|tara:strand:+ start:1384 stop:1785 length:402 start_codon:yes stop_codon:yes gene_type:complete
MTPEEIVEKMISKDSFSKWLNLDIISIKKGSCSLKTTITKEMSNGFNLSHGGICFSIADSCLAFAANSYGKISLTKSAEIKFIKMVNINDTITAKCHHSEIDKNNFNIDLINQNHEKIANFIGTVHFTNKVWS